MTAPSDISWSTPSGTFNLRVAAVISRDEHILLCTVNGLGYWILPGGTLALVAENIYRGAALHHGIGLYYRLTWPADLAPDDLHRGTEPGHHFRWVPARELGPAGLQPAGLIPVLPDLIRPETAGTLRHVVLRPD